MIEPTGYTALDLIGFTDKGNYNPNATYVKNDLVHDDNGSIWRVLIDDTSGVTPAEGLNYTIFIRNQADAAKQIIAPVESSPTANAHAAGTQIIYHNVLYDVTTAIAAGGALVVYPTSGYNIKPAALVTSQIQALSNIVKTVEDFGAVGDGVTDDTQPFIDAFDYGHDNNCTITTKSKTYVVNSDLVIDHFIFDGNNCTIKTSNKITLNGKSQMQNVTVDGGNIVVDNGLNAIFNTLVKDFNNAAYTFTNDDYESLAIGLRIENNNYNPNTIGFLIEGSDTTLTSLYGYGATIGIKVTGGGIYIVDAHLWVRRGEFANSKFLVFANMVHLTNCVIDTYQYAFSPMYDYLRLICNNCVWMSNNAQITNASFYFIEGNFTHNLFTGDCLLGLRNFGSSGNMLTYGNFGKMEIRTTDATGSETTDKLSITYADVATAQGITGASGFGQIESNGGFLTANLILYFYSDAQTSLASFDLTSLLPNVKRLPQIRMLGKAVYDSIGAAFIYVDININGTISFDVPAMYSGHTIKEYSFEICHKLGVFE